MGWIIDLLKDVPLSAVIREQFISVEKQLATAEKKISSIEAENAKLQSQVRELRQEIQRRDDVIQDEKSHDTFLDKIEEKILLFLYSRGRKGATVDQVVRDKTVSLSPLVAKMHLTKLFDLDMVKTYPGNDRLNYYRLEDPGTEYLIKHKLITQPVVPADG